MSDEERKVFWHKMNRMTAWQHKDELIPPSVDGTFLEWDKLDEPVESNDS